jgi:hypothetical protein
MRAFLFWAARPGRRRNRDSSDSGSESEGAATNCYRQDSSPVSRAVIELKPLKSPLLFRQGQQRDDEHCAGPGADPHERPIPRLRVVTGQ